ncbi:MAG: peroxide stress protein YaaA [Saprospiraceae bacterium]|nr:peroxide stress protein YaaA [Saprospiraceae bacterium]
MIAIISPSKDLNFKTPVPHPSLELPRLLDSSTQLIDELKKKSVKKLMHLMDISEKLANENSIRYHNFSNTFTLENSRPSIYAFAGEVYRGIDAYNLNDGQLKYCQNHVRILSGLYGLLRPLDLIQAYRLEMGVPLTIQRKKNLYKFWGSRITELLNQDLAATKSDFLINLASKEYFEVIDPKLIQVPIQNIHFREYKNEKLMFVSFTAKKARGLMVRYMALENCKNLDDLKGFNLEGYHFETKLSNETDWYFIR